MMLTSDRKKTDGASCSPNTGERTELLRRLALHLQGRFDFSKAYYLPDRDQNGLSDWLSAHRDEDASKAIRAMEEAEAEDRCALFHDPVYRSSPLSVIEARHGQLAALCVAAAILAEAAIICWGVGVLRAKHLGWILSPRTYPTNLGDVLRTVEQLCDEGVLIVDDEHIGGWNEVIASRSLFKSFFDYFAGGSGTAEKS